MSKSYSDLESDVKAIDRVRQAHVAAVNSTNAEAWVMMFTEDGVQMPPFAPANIGKNMMINWVRGFLDVFVLEDFALSVAELQVKGDWALERGTYTINFTHRPSGNVIPDLGKYITIWQRLPDGAWGMARDIWNSDNPPLPMGGESEANRIAAEQHKSTIRRFYEEGVNKGNAAVFDEVISPDYVSHFFPPDLPHGPEGVKRFVAAFRGAFPDIHVTCDEIIVEGEMATSHITIRATHNGEFQGIVPTGKPVTVEAIDLWRFARGKASEGWGGPNVLSLLHQLGPMPPR